MWIVLFILYNVNFFILFYIFVLKSILSYVIPVFLVCVCLIYFHPFLTFLSQFIYFYFLFVFFIKFEPVCLMFISYTQYLLGFTFWYKVKVVFIDEISHLNGLIRQRYLVLMLSCFLFSWFYVGYYYLCFVFLLRT